VRPICEAGTRRSKRMKNVASAVGILAVNGEEDINCHRLLIHIHGFVLSVSLSIRREMRKLGNFWS